MELLLVFITLVLCWGVFIYNRLVRDRNRVLTAWSDIDVQLKRRHDLIPELVEAVRQYAAYESATMAAVTDLRLRSKALQSVTDISELEQHIGIGLSRLVALAEEYPDLKASASFLDLQHRLTEVEDTLQYARRYYNGAVRNLNVRIESFPDMLVAHSLGFKQAQLFNFELTVTTARLKS